MEFFFKGDVCVVMCDRGCCCCSINKDAAVSWGTKRNSSDVWDSVLQEVFLHVSKFILSSLFLMCTRICSIVRTDTSSWKMRTLKH
jgi:hypothetical protein